MNTYERERLQLIREKAHAHPHNYHSDFHFLLSLYASQVEFGKRFAEKTYVGQYDAVNDAATRMRDLCVDAIKSLRATPHGAAYNNAINDAIHKVESLTSDQVEKKIMNEKDSQAIHDLFYEFHTPDNLGLLKSKLVDYVTTVRQGAREAAFKDADAIIDAAGEEWGRQARDGKSKTYSAYVIAALDLKGRLIEAAAN